MLLLRIGRGRADDDGYYSGYRRRVDDRELYKVRRERREKEERERGERGKESKSILPNVCSPSHRAARAQGRCEFSVGGGESFGRCCSGQIFGIWILPCPSP